MVQGNPMTELIGNSKGIQAVRHLVAQVANTQANVLILGESGTGKELIAQLVHQGSDRMQGPFIPVNCAAIPDDLLESELFGHEKGAFTGAHILRQGRFELAAGGTLFLDEIGDMPIAMQAKLLRVLQERQFERIGGSKPIGTNVRVIAATNKNLEASIQLGHFREDLYYRLNVFPIDILPLRDRRDDIPLLLDYFLKQFQDRENTCVHLSEGALEKLMQYAWPGNIRELANVSERLVILFAGGTIEASDLPEPILQSQCSYQSNKHRDDKNMTILIGKSFKLKEHLLELEMNFIHEALDQYHGVVSHAAKKLGLQRTTLVEKMKKLGITRGRSL